MALTPSAVDPKRKENLTKMKELSETKGGRDILEAQFNTVLSQNDKIVVKSTETKAAEITEEEANDPSRKGTVSAKSSPSQETKKI